MIVIELDSVSVEVEVWCQFVPQLCPLGVVGRLPAERLLFNVECLNLQTLLFYSRGKERGTDITGLRPKTKTKFKNQSDQRGKDIKSSANFLLDIISKSFISTYLPLDLAYITIYTKLFDWMLDDKEEMIIYSPVNNVNFCSGKNCIFKWVFFVQYILADRYVHRREL